MHSKRNCIKKFSKTRENISLNSFETNSWSISTFKKNHGPTTKDWHKLPFGGLQKLTNNSIDQIISFASPQYHKALLNDPETGEAIYRITNRGGKGVKTLTVTEKTGNLIAIKVVTDDDDIMIINKSGITIRMHVADIRTQGRATQGVKLINLKGKDQIAAVAKVEKDDEDMEESNEALTDGND